MMLQITAYTIAVAAALSVVALCAERLARLYRLPRRAAWAGAMLLSVLLPAVMILLAKPAETGRVPASSSAVDVPLVARDPVVFAEMAAAQVSDSELPSGSSAQSVPATPATKFMSRATGTLPRSSDRLIVTAWLATSILLALYLLGANILLRRRMKGWRIATVQDHEVLVSEATGPALLGAFSPRIVVPSWLLLLPHGIQALILQHEKQHVLARDALLVLAGLVVIIAVPWNLPLWWQWRRLRLAMEQDCDARVLDTGAEARVYAEVLLAITKRSTRIPAGALAMSEPVHALERRIADLLPDATRFAMPQTIAVLLLGAAGTSAALALEAPALPGRAATIPAAAQSGADVGAPSAIVPAAMRSPAPAHPGTALARRRAGEHIVAAVTRGDIEDLVTASGTLAPREFADVEALVPGRIRKLHVGVGDVVRQGDLLAEIDAQAVVDKVEVLRLQLRVAESELGVQLGIQEMAEREYQRLMQTASATGEARLNAESAINKARSSVKQASAQVDALMANLRSEERNLGNTRIVAPMGGTIMKVHVEQGQPVIPTQNQTVVMRIADLSTLTVIAAVSEADVTRLRKGMTAYLTTLGDDSRRWYGELRRIEPTPQIHNGVVSYNALFDVRNDRAMLRPQMTAKVNFVNAEARNVLRVPMAALRQGRNASPARDMQRRNDTVLVMKADGTLEARPVVVGVSDRVYGEVLEGLKDGEEVVVGP